ncbi:MAG: GHMP kinase [Kiritimatiellae bacterium]|nr:GHMP kinase [Kiritimatiellia bacterium]
MKVFVPGRICLLGEHTDWAGGYRRINANLERGVAIIAGTNQGIHAEVKPHPNKLILRCTLENGERRGPYEIDMDRDALLEVAEQGGFLSYAAGVAYQVLTHYRVRGLEIDNYLTDLPVKKGLSSSAAICVLVARAFNRVYDLKMTVRGEMEYAYGGEITTPSRCGRLDQGCAYGNRPIMMTFDGDRLDVDELSVPHSLHYVIVDLMAEKDTLEILQKLNNCYPFAESDLQRNVQEFLGPISAGITREAAEAISKGDVEEVGRLMTKAQEEFDRCLQPACPSQLTAPVLHKLLNHEPLQPLMLGAKGVGSQGDGTAQILVRTEEDQSKAIEIVERDLKMHCLRLTIQSGQRVRKAVIPAAGMGTRLFPATKSVKKELFPIIDRDGRAKPVIMTIVEEVLNAGVEEVAIIVQKEDKDLFESFFGLPPRIEHYNKLSQDDKEYSDYLMGIGRRVTLLTQDTQEGFGHAVYCAREWVGAEPFMLLLGDHIYSSDTDESCALQLMNQFAKTGHSVVGLKRTPVDKVKHFGCVTGEWDDDDGQLLSITEFAEKPSEDYAREHLRVEGMESDEYLTLFGQYVLTPKVFEYLEEHISGNLRESGEFQLTSCLDRVRKEEGFAGHIVQGRRYDIGLPDAYRQTVIDFRMA